MLSVVTDEAGRAELAMDLDQLVREGARRMLAAALEAEVDAYLAAHHDQGDERGHRLVVRNEGRWRAVNGPHLVALVRAGVTFDKGKLVERCHEVVA